MAHITPRHHAEMPKGIDDASSPQATFHYLQKLPLEIRIMIWREALGPLPESRLIRVSLNLSRENPYIAPNANQLFDNDAPKYSSVPLVLSICKESRTVAKRYYDFCFQRQPKLKSYFKLAGTRFEKQTYHGILFQPARDTISFGDMSENSIRWALKMAESVDLKLNNIQSLVIPKTESSIKLAHLIFQDSEDHARFLPRRHELIIVARPGICKPTVFETRIEAILNGLRDPRLENFMIQLQGMKRGIEKELRRKPGMETLPMVRLMDQATLNRWVAEPQLRRDGLPWDVLF
jgi:hypothetical protein